MVSVLILTKNEQQDLPGCLDSVSWADDVVVYDSYSTDATVQIAKGKGARVVQREFDNYASQRNVALHEVEYKHPWVLILDADERVPTHLYEEIKRVLQHASDSTAAFRIRRRDYLGKIWLRHVQASPYYIRLVRPELVHYEREVNEVLKANGEIVDLAEPFDHYPFSKGMAHWLAKHNTYSTMEADQVLKSRRGHAPFSPLKAFTEKDFNERRFHQKELFYRLPARPLVKFLILYLLKRGFLDGRAGFTYATLQSIYEYMIVLKTRELEASRPAE